MLERRRPLTPFGRAVKRVLAENSITTRALCKELKLSERYLSDAFYGLVPAYEYQWAVAEYLKRHFGADIPYEVRQRRGG